MTTKSHKTLTGNQLHEPKGADTATVDKVYVSDGAGSGAWAKLTASQLQTTGNPFGAQLLHVRDEKTSGTAAQTLTANAWSTRELNTTKTNEITSASLASNQITLPAGTYFIDAAVPAYQSSSHKAKLANITDGTDTILGTTEFENPTGAGVAVSTRSFIKGRFTISGTKVFEIQHKTGYGNPGGTQASFGTEVYTEVLIWKVL